MQIACIGLGRMGWHIAAHLSCAERGHLVTVFDVASGVANDWATQHRGVVGTSSATAASGAEIIITSLPADEQISIVAQQIVPRVSPGAVWVDHSTTSARCAREVAALVASADAQFLDAPVSGGVDGARAGTLTVMAGGAQHALDRVQHIVASYAARITLMGDSGAGQITKMTNQICVIGLCQALAEGLDFASRAGLDVKKVIHVMLQGSSASWQMQNRADKMLAGDYDFGFSTTLMRKDLGLVLDEARSMGAALPVTELVSGYLNDVDAMGGANWDWCSLMERQRKLTG